MSLTLQMHFGTFKYVFEQFLLCNVFKCHVYQLQLPEGAKPLTFILYANKTRLSTSGTAKAYFIVAQLANLPTDIHNEEGIGCGYVVGWLPVVCPNFCCTDTSLFANR
jgi:hypothetical protein